MVGPLLDDVEPFGVAVWGVPRYHTRPTRRTSARTTPMITPDATPPPLSFDPGGALI
jgi:hypothetical protein